MFSNEQCSPPGFPLWGSTTTQWHIYGSTKPEQTDQYQPTRTFMECNQAFLALLKLSLNKQLTC